MTNAGRPPEAGSEIQGETGKGKRRIPFLLAVAGLAYAIDLFSKVAVVAHLENHAPVELIGNVLELRVMRNPGAAFSIGEATTILFTVIAVAVTLAIIRMARKLYSVPWAIALGLLLGGALGNLTDRLLRSPGHFQGAVVDFISVRGFSVMNLADWAIVCGGILIVFFTFRGWELDNTSKKPDAENTESDNSAQTART
ncbi:signal peptidase II [Streptomyces pinistramenti]|uniref:signal peptidase II n=1 Tax=Streptomyces pinistramenti TaxID=2884812 RepID=UPI001D069B91|nr:signal peptidase II [Streptomyces pinistramenti]MCB5911600.1 signal peptidase II [Streptomyces pinistramenti]